MFEEPLSLEGKLLQFRADIITLQYVVARLVNGQDATGRVAVVDKLKSTAEDYDGLNARLPTEAATMEEATHQLHMAAKRLLQIIEQSHPVA